MHEEAGFLRRTLDAGGAGYVLKRAAETELLAAIRAVHRGEAFVDPAMTRTLIQDYLGQAEPVAQPSASTELSPRETEVLALIAAGYTNQQIAEKLVISVKTVEIHKTHIYGKARRPQPRGSGALRAGEGPAPIALKPLRSL